MIHDGCGVRALGDGGIEGVIELPAAACPQAYLAFCYDAERGPS